MSRSNKIFRLVQSQVPSTLLCKDMLVVPPTEFILRGFLLNTTSKKAHMTLWKVVMPLQRPHSSIVLNYSHVIGGKTGGLIFIDESAYERSAAQVLEKIGEHVHPLRRLQRPQDFLKYAAHMSCNGTIPVMMDFGLTHYLLGNIMQAREIFRDLERKLRASHAKMQAHYSPLVRQILNQLELDPPGLLDIIYAWRDQNIETFGLASTLPSLKLVKLSQDEKS